MILVEVYYIVQKESKNKQSVLQERRNNLNLFENFKKLINNENEINKQEKIIVNNYKISQDEINLAQKLNAIEIFTVDRIEDDIVVLENRTKNTKQ